MDNVRPLRPKKQPPKPRRDRRTRRRVITAVIVAVVVHRARVRQPHPRHVRRLAVVRRGRLPRRVLDAHLGAAAARRSSPSSSSSSSSGPTWSWRGGWRRTSAPTSTARSSSRAARPCAGGSASARPLVCVVVAFIAAVAASGSWQRVLLYFNQVPWGEKDPIFGRDISFYVFSMPFWQGVLSFVLAALIVSLVLAAIVHLIMGGIDIKQKPGKAARGRRRGGTLAVRPRPAGRAADPADRPQARRPRGGAPLRAAGGDLRRRRHRPAVQGLEPAVLDGRRRSTAPATRTCTSACR